MLSRAMLDDFDHEMAVQATEGTSFCRFHHSNHPECPRLHIWSPAAHAWREKRGIPMALTTYLVLEGKRTVSSDCQRSSGLRSAQAARPLSGRASRHRGMF